MEHIFKKVRDNWRTALAGCFGVVSIGGAYFLAGGFTTPPVATASMESALLNAIAKKDSDGDGLSDWQETLYGTHSNIVDTFKLGMTDGEAVARGLIVPLAVADIKTEKSQTSVDADGLPPAPKEGTLTDAFAKTIFTLFLKAKKENGGGDLSDAQMDKVVKESMESLSSVIKSAPDFKIKKDLILSSDNSAEALKEFAMQAEAVMDKNKSTATTSEINYLKRIIEDDEVTAIPSLVSIAKSYREMAIGLSVLTVPEILGDDYLRLINAMMRISTLASDFARVLEDPLTTILAMQQYPETVTALIAGFTNIGATYKTAGVSLAKGSAGASFVNLIADLAQKQVVNKKVKK